MGSRHYARYLMQKREPMIGMLSLETMGYFKDEPNTQRYPPPFSWIYPSEGNFIAFVGMLGSRDLVRAVIGSFRDHTSFPSVGGVAPGFITGIDWSDHTSFADFGVPALMVTDTATFRYPYYHTPEDTLDKVDTEKLARVTMGIDRVIRDMASPRWPTKSFASRD
jgi:Zn-dependent M28 family amino/carboxypeptidase